MNPASHAMTPAAMIPRSSLCASCRGACGDPPDDGVEVGVAGAAAGSDAGGGGGGGVAEPSGWLLPSPRGAAGLSPCWSVMCVLISQFRWTGSDSAQSLHLPASKGNDLAGASEPGYRTG